MVTCWIFFNHLSQNLDKEGSGERLIAHFQSTVYLCFEVRNVHFHSNQTQFHCTKTHFKNRGKLQFGNGLFWQSRRRFWLVVSFLWNPWKYCLFCNSKPHSFWLKYCHVWGITKLMFKFTLRFIDSFYSTNQIIQERYVSWINDYKASFFSSSTKTE